MSRPPSTNSADAVRRAILSLEGLSLGDAFGERFFVGNDAAAATLVARRELPTGPWRWTDDTAMAIPIVEELARMGRIDSDRLALAFVRRYLAEPTRGYGRGTHQALAAIAAGTPWDQANRLAFPAGSSGNGSAMRSAPVGAYFAGDTARIVAAAAASSVPTHSHPDAVAGAIAVALAAGYAAAVGPRRGRDGLLRYVGDATPAGPVQVALERALGLDVENPQEAASILGSGQHVRAEDTVPFALWCADRHLDSFEEAMWATVAGLGDRDMTCAMVGGIVALAVGRVPDAWRARREALPGLG